MVAPKLSEALCHRLTSGLRRWGDFWREVPFHQPRLSWVQTQPELAAWVLALDEAALARYSADPDTMLPEVARWLPEVVDWLNALRLPSLSAALPECPPFFHVDVPGRKWQQILHFSAALKVGEGRKPGSEHRVASGEHLVDWCSGKGHLSRVATQVTGLPVLALERDAHLCADGQALADRWQLPIRLQQTDVMHDTFSLSANSHAIALHACGDLHRRLLEQVVAARASVTLSPCCYHLQQGERYRPMARGMDLPLRRDDLRLAVQETVTAPANVRRQRAQQQIYRLGFDALQREVLGSDNYLPLPSLPVAMFRQDFAAFCRAVAAQRSLALPQVWDADVWFEKGRVRWHDVCRYEVIRHLFRRPLELWLLMDRVRFLEQAGYDVEVGEFCPRPLTPRNLLIRATRPSS